MKATVTLEPEKRSESETRESIDKAARHARDMARARGHGDVGHEEMRRKMQEHAVRDDNKQREKKGE